MRIVNGWAREKGRERERERQQRVCEQARRGQKEHDCWLGLAVGGAAVGPPLWLPACVHYRCHGRSHGFCSTLDIADVLVVLWQPAISTLTPPYRAHTHAELCARRGWQQLGRWESSCILRTLRCQDFARVQEWVMRLKRICMYVYSTYTYNIVGFSSSTQ